MLRRQLLRIGQQAPRNAFRAPGATRIQPFASSPRFRAEQPETAAAQPDPRDSQISELKEKHAKSRADVKNLEEQSKRELHAAKSFAIQRLARDLLDTVDNLARAAKVVNADAKQDAERHKEFADLLEDLEKVEARLMGTLMNHGLTVIEPTGEKFDPNVHEATFEMPMPGKEAGTVFYVEQKGYSLNGRVLRPAKVGIVKEIE